MTMDAPAEVARLNSIEQAQKRLNVGRSTVFALIKSRKLRSVRVARRRLIPEQSLRDFIAQLDAEASELDGNDSD